MTAKAHTGRLDGGATRAARAALVDRLTALPQITTARITSDVAPLRIEGTLHDRRPYFFRAHWGEASLSIAAVAKNQVDSSALTKRIPCPFGLTIETDDDTLDVISTLLEQHHL
ncbi:hypothetical protein NQK81_01485 [Amycolatopsis roodepoortensis]|uniref:hypothetical protein n=1 Tax=Amycolatopsis roodepoortensis TaxID=700274 RepID=UPI00214A9029|nr:hypothetical protein [Amycolatopsis roodepoortensis]UUV32148.1 hypothetical protein NQK81_01485 [Amycolatopsis roodepoortensis]